MRLRKRERLRCAPLIMLSGVAAETGERFDQEGAGSLAWSRLDRFVDKPATRQAVVGHSRRVPVMAAARNRTGARSAWWSMTSTGCAPASARSSRSKDTRWRRRPPARRRWLCSRPATSTLRLLDYRLPDIDGLTIQQDHEDERPAADDLHDHGLRRTSTPPSRPPAKASTSSCPSRSCPTTCSASSRPW